MNFSLDQHKAALGPFVEAVQALTPDNFVVSGGILLGEDQRVQSVIFVETGGKHRESWMQCAPFYPSGAHQMARWIVAHEHSRDSNTITLDLPSIAG